MRARDWEKKVLAAEGAEERVSEIEDELRLGTGLTTLREQAGPALAGSTEVGPATGGGQATVPLGTTHCVLSDGSTDCRWSKSAS